MCTEWLLTVYSGGNEARSMYRCRLFWLGIFVVFLGASNISIRLRRTPSKSFPLHNSQIYYTMDAIKSQISTAPSINHENVGNIRTTQHFARSHNVCTSSAALKAWYRFIPREPFCGDLTLNIPRGVLWGPHLVCYWLTSAEINKHKIFDTNNAWITEL